MKDSEQSEPRAEPTSPPAPGGLRGWWSRWRAERRAPKRATPKKPGVVRRGWTRHVAGVVDVALVFLALAIVAVAGQHAAATASNVPGGWRLPVFLILLPFGLTYTSLLSARSRLTRTRFELAHPPGNYSPTDQRILLSVQKSWSYERLLFRAALGKVGLHAQIYGLVTTLTLGLTYLICFPLPKPTADGYTMVPLVAVAAASAATVSFAIHFGRIVVRLASQDFNARMYSWATRSMLLSLCATVVAAMFLTPKAGSGAPLVQWFDRAVLLGATVAALGDQVLEFVVAKAASLFGIAVRNPAGAADLEQIAGLTQDDVARLAEEGIESTHGLAYVPTARLFFSTNHSLQRLVDWQDQALLLQWVGSARAKSLADRLMVRGAIDLWGTVVALDAAPDDARRIALAQALGMDESQVSSIVKLVEHDQVVRRLHAHYVSTAWVNPGTEPVPVLNVTLMNGVGPEDLERIVANALVQRPGLTEADEARVRAVVEQALQSAADSRPGLFARPEFGQVMTECLRDALAQQPPSAPVDLEALARVLQESVRKAPTEVPPTRS
ncbi:hypothetical protein SAMN05443572_10771 [Myxococcus fulvus]|uniref:RDD domain-containing protein n=1 Tax=Myxococcus fulvus TaxID=33 RepID=A0ABY1CPD8_MYXFU|nr:hypothetical protein [Myxococcus fulvus]SEU25261.1 hypothetical protein SAMN05443572_10771 [Myxococcus fulvus]